jgi:hypothetical protein
MASVDSPPESFDFPLEKAEYLWCPDSVLGMASVFGLYRPVQQVDR